MCCWPTERIPTAATWAELGSNLSRPSKASYPALSDMPSLALELSYICPSSTCLKLPVSFSTLVPFHWYYLQFHSRVGSAARQLKAFPRPQSVWKAWAHPRWPGGDVWFRHYCHSQLWQTLVRIQELIEKIHAAWIFPLVAFFVVVLWEPSCFLDSICPPGPWTAAQCVSWWLQGLWGEKSLLEKKREGSSRASANTSVFVVHPDCPSAQQGKRVSLVIITFLLFSLWWKECRCKVVFVYHALGCMQAPIWLKNSPFIRWPTFVVDLRLFASIVKYWPKGIKCN